MPTKTASITLDGDGFRLAGRTGTGHAVVLDTNEGDAGPRPAELIPLALGGCTALDVISILRKKQQQVATYEVRVAGTQDDDHPNAFSSFDVVHVVSGQDLDVKAVRRAIELSAIRYCSVGATLSSGRSTVEHRFVALDLATGIESSGVVVRIGPAGAITEPVVA